MEPSAPTDTDLTFFARTLEKRRRAADHVIAGYWQAKLAEVHSGYGDASWETMQAFTEILGRGGKRIRASLAESSYRMFGGDDQRVIDGMSLVLEMVHAYLLITDDISDRSDLRRGGPSAHRIVEAWHERAELGGDQQHFGASLATLAAMTGLHMAMGELTKLPASPGRIRSAADNLNHLLVTTCQGQINDLWNEVSSTDDQTNIENVLLWKTAYYSFINPLQLGAILTGATDGQLNTLRQYGLSAGRAFQISDDIIGLLGSEADTGKDAMGDIREGKRTLLINQALSLAGPDDAHFLATQLSNAQLTPEAFQRCRDIVSSSGALAHAQRELERSCREAHGIIQGGGLPDGQERQFLCGLTDYLRTRKA